ncbi:MAG: MFS family permease [Cyclobacteriaceae bacterium]|jgi:MFS family permease
MDPKVKQRIALSTFFYLSGFGFATWTSRIPTIKATLGLTDVELGSILLVMPIASLIGLPLSGYLVSKFSTRVPMIVGFVLYALGLLSIGLASSKPILVASMFMVAFFMRIVNVSMNTQSITVQKNYHKSINGSFHALWSFGGITGVGFTTLMIMMDVSIVTHLIIFTTLVIPASVLAFQFLILADKPLTGNKLILSKPDPFIMALGFIIFLASICEGGMFDWSGIYFREVIQVEIFTLGFLLFMTCMTLSRLGSDFVIQSLGLKTTFLISALLIALGIGISVLFPTFYTALIGFSIVGFGVAPIVPIALMQAGESKKYAAGIVVAIISTFGTTGMLIGPPVIGYLSHLFGLKFSFLIILIAGLAIIPISRYFFKIKAKTA